MHSLLTLLAHAERERDAALAALRRLQIEQRNAQAQADQLQSYRRDYEQRWSSEFSRSGGIAIVHCYQGFVTRLGQAIEQQTHVAQIATQRLTQAETVWREFELRVASVGKLIGRRNVALRDQEGRREQKLQDDQATRMAWERRSNRFAPA
ncbi:MAG: flagellar export protein FliJ [Burkholderiales bacterium]